MDVIVKLIEFHLNAPIISKVFETVQVGLRLLNLEHSTSTSFRGHVKDAHGARFMVITIIKPRSTMNDLNGVFLLLIRDKREGTVLSFERCVLPIQVHWLK